jgi:hypothetical protein
MTVRLSDSIQRRLNAYALAASAAGVATLALAKLAEAKIVYTPANVQITNAFHLDVNGDGINDFTFYFFKSVQLNSATGSFSFLSVVPSNFSHNGIMGKPVGTSYPASALGSGVQISSKNNFRGFAMAQRWHHPGKGTSTFRDPWANGGQGVASGYLGLKFEIQRTIHYGWARLSVGPGNAVATLTGYAYETTPNIPIVAGQTQGPYVITVKPATLGRLAQGSAGRSGK